MREEQACRPQSEKTRQEAPSATGEIPFLPMERPWWSRSIPAACREDHYGTQATIELIPTLQPMGDTMSQQVDIP